MPDQLPSVLYTRNQAHYRNIARKLAPYPLTLYHLPLMDTRAIPYRCDDAPCSAEQYRQLLQQCDSLIFTSAAAARYFDQRHIPQHADIIAIGKNTAAALPYTTLIAPPPYTSEALLSLYRPKQRNILIISGKGGREHLCKTLSHDNQVHKIAVYERYNPSTHWCFPPTQTFNAITLASVETLKNLIQITPQPVLKLLQCHSHIISLSERISKMAKLHGFLCVITATYAEENAQLETLLHILGVTHE